MARRTLWLALGAVSGAVIGWTACRVYMARQYKRGVQRALNGLHEEVVDDG